MQNTGSDANARIRYLESKVIFFQNYCRELVETGAPRPERSATSNLMERLNQERARVAELQRNIESIRAHRDDVTRQIEHQHAHILSLTEKIKLLESKLSEPAGFWQVLRRALAGTRSS